MRYHPLLRHGVLVLSLGVAHLPTWAGDDCEAPLNRWQSREAVQQMAAQKGWQIQRLKIDDGCYEIRATDAQGRPFKAKLDPETLKVLAMKQSHHQHDRTRHRDRDGAAGQSPPASPASAPAVPPRRLIE
ncbi:MAG: PepSY domain-containing protein [Aquabacterium sp.]